jgi:hypothetical protein
MNLIAHQTQQMRSAYCSMPGSRFVTYKNFLEYNLLHLD